MTATDATPRTPRIGSLQWWIRDKHGRVVLAQAPNAAIVVWLVSWVISWVGVLDDRRDAILSRVGQGALVVWGLDELTRGASPARRLLGALVLIAMLVRLFA